MDCNYSFRWHKLLLHLSSDPGFYTEGGEPWDFPPPPDMLSPPEIFQRINFLKLHYKGIITLEFLNCITKESLHYKGILRLFCLNISKISSKFTFLRSGASIAIRMILERFRSPKRFRSLVFIIFMIDILCMHQKKFPPSLKILYKTL